MARAATRGHLPEDVQGHKSKFPRPVLDPLVPQESSMASSLHSQRPNSSMSHTNGHHAGSEEENEEDEGLHMRPAHGARVVPNLSRATSDASHGSRKQMNGDEAGDDEDPKMRHGWEEQLDKDQTTALTQNFFMYFEDKRHETAGNPPPAFDPRSIVCDWRMRDRLKTVSAVLAVCLNVGVDPPDVIKTNPCARLECWVDPIPPDSANQSSTNNSNAQIGKNLQSQYENLSVRTRYKIVLDPTIDELKRYTTSARRGAGSDRVLFHYNGHGVPKPTNSGEVWCFNRSYTQYIPIGLYDLQEWVGAPSLWVWDCSSAAGIITGFRDGAQKHMNSQREAMAKDPNLRKDQLIRWDQAIHLAACREDETLPTNPDLPADIFTACLTSPIAMAVRFFILQNPLSSTSNITLAQARDIPGKVSERRTPLGELNWIFTAITDTIAWNCLEKQTFKKLFRQDLMVAALFRNFLLAQRIMRIYNCNPQSFPAIPTTYDHPLWQSWDLAIEMILAQLPKLIEQQKANEALQEQQPTNAPPTPPPEIEYIHSDFFADQLSAFEVFLASAPANAGAQGYAKAPEQLPIVLQVLLSQVHRLRALILLSKFLDLGPWAVNLALSIGIFPYVLKLLQSQALELKPPMVFIWARILAVDSSCQTDLLKEKDSGYMYFTNILHQATGIPMGNVAEHRAMCCFVIAMFCKDHRAGKQAVMESNPEIIATCLAQLDDMENPLLRQFSLLCISHLWKDYLPAKRASLQHTAHLKISDSTHDPVPEVRAACLHALTSFIGTGEVEPGFVREEESLVGVVLSVGMDGSIMVRKELTVFYSTFIKKYEQRFIVAAWEQLLEERDKRAGKDVENDAEPLDNTGDTPGREGPNQPNGVHSSRPNHVRQVSFARSEIIDLEPPVSKPTRTLSKKTIYRAIWRQILSMSSDPHPEVAKNAGIVVDYIILALLRSGLGNHANDILDEVLQKQSKKAQNLTVSTMEGLSRQKSREQRPQTPPSPSASTMSKQDGYFSGGLSRTASVAAAMKNLVGWGSRAPSSENPPSPTKSHRGSFQGASTYRSRPLAPADAAQMAPDALDNFAGPDHQPPAMVPHPPNFTPRDMNKMPVIPLESNFFTWSASYFREPQMRPSEADEPGSLDYNERLWRRNRNDKIIASTQPLKEAAGSQKWDVPCGWFGIGAAPMKMVFHQFEDHLVTSDDRDSIAVWDWKEQTQLSRFSNANPPGSRVTELRFINEDDQAMLMTGSSDGVIKIFKNYDDLKKIELASSFRALSDLVISDRRNAGLVFDWQQGQGRILVAGDERVVRVWQAGHELCITDIPARSGSCITCLTSDQVEGNVFVAGFGNGSVRAYDLRLSSHESMIMSWTDRTRDHKSWIVGAHLQRGGLRELISAESNGGVRLWDIRMKGAVASLDSKREPRNLRALSVHEHAPVFATGGADHTIRVYNTSLKHLSSFEPYMSYLRLANSSRHAPITATAFHPHRMMLACGAVNDGHVNLFKCDATADEKQGGVVDEWKA